MSPTKVEKSIGNDDDVNASEASEAKPCVSPRKVKVKADRSKDFKKQGQGVSGFLSRFLFSSAQSVLEYVAYLLGFNLSSPDISSSEDTVHGKRKRDDPADGEEADVTGDTEEIKLKEKRWRPDVVFQAVESFISSVWGVKDSNENIKPDHNDENMNSFSTGHEEQWNKRPEINFFSDSIISSIDDIGNSGPNFYPLIFDSNSLDLLIRNQRNFNTTDISGGRREQEDLHLLSGEVGQRRVEHHQQRYWRGALHVTSHLRGEAGVLRTADQGAGGSGQRQRYQVPHAREEHLQPSHSGG